jgi:hypothetical protein
VAKTSLVATGHHRSCPLVDLEWGHRWRRSGCKTSKGISLPSGSDGERSDKIFQPGEYEKVMGGRELRVVAHVCATGWWPREDEQVSRER